MEAWCSPGSPILQMISDINVVSTDFWHRGARDIYTLRRGNLTRESSHVASQDIDRPAGIHERILLDAGDGKAGVEGRSC